MTADSLKLFRTAVDAYQRENWRAIADLCDQESLSRFKENLVSVFAPPPNDALPLTATELMKAVPGMPRSVAEYQVHRFREGSNPEARLREMIPAIESVKALEAMKPVEVFAAWMQARSFRAEIERAFERKQMTRAMANSILAAGESRGEFHTLGVVEDGGSVRYVVFRRGDGRPDTVMVRRQPNDSWMLVADPYFMSIAGDSSTRLYTIDVEADED